MLKRILIVVDSPLMRKMFALHLARDKSAGLELHYAQNGEEALSVLAERPFLDLILVDFRMAALAGLEFLDACKRKRVHRNIPIIFASVDTSPEMVSRCLKAGATAILKKPFTYEELQAVITKADNTLLPSGRPTTALRAVMTA